MKKFLQALGFIAILFTVYSCDRVLNKIKHIDGVKVTELDCEDRADAMLKHLEKNLLAKYCEINEDSYEYDWKEKWEEESNNVVAIDVTFRFTANNPLKKVRFGRCKISGVLRIAKDDKLVYFEYKEANEHLKKIVKENAWDIFDVSEFGTRIKYPNR